VIIVTSSGIEGKKIVKTLGMVKGSTIRARHLGRDISAGLRSLIGGEITEYTKLMAEAREEAIQRMVEQAEEMGANAILDVRFVTSMVVSGSSELLVYGTAVIVK
jgi:uncharacterized protein YbjQ (UPF0145 family)